MSDIVITKAQTMKHVTKREAQAIDDNIVSLLRQADSSVTAAAIQIRKFVDGRMWLCLGYKNLSEWKEKIFRQDWMFYQLNCVNKLMDMGVNQKAIEGMPLTNIVNMTRLPQNLVLKANWLRDAKDMPVDKFKQKVYNCLDDKGLHPETKVKRGFSVDIDTGRAYDLALKVAQVVDGATTHAEMIECIVFGYLTSPSGTGDLERIEYYNDITGKKVSK